MRKTFQLSKKRLIACVVALLLLLAAALVLYVVSVWENRPNSEIPSSGVSSQDGRSEIYVDGDKYTLKDNVESVLFIGVDTYETEAAQSYINGQQADLLMLLVLDHADQSYTVMQLNRDTMTQIKTLGVTGESSGTITAQLALAHAYGTGQNDSSRNTVKAVSNLLYGVDIAHYATIRMNAIPVLNDAVGGVTVELLDDFTDLDSAFTKGATVTLSGDQATAYVQYRSQLENNTNISRMARQKQYMTAWSAQLKVSLEQDESFVSATVMEISDDLISDLTVEQMNKLAGCFETYASKGILEVAGESVQGEEFMEFHVDEEALQQQVLDLFYAKVE